MLLLTMKYELSTLGEACFKIKHNMHRRIKPLRKILRVHRFMGELSAVPMLKERKICLSIQAFGECMHFQFATKK
jgi:hypothetical protein